jgi:hypothetical protein
MNTPTTKSPSPLSNDDSLVLLMNDVFPDSSDEEYEGPFDEIDLDTDDDEKLETPKKEEIDPPAECCVCYEELGKTNVTTTPCGHTFCFSCLMKCMDVKNSCPYCREPLRDEEDIIQSSDDEDEYSDDEDDDEDSITSEDELDLSYENASNPTLGLIKLNEMVELLDKCSISREEFLGMLLYRYEDGVDPKNLHKKKEMFNEMINKKDKERKNEWEERTSMMEEDTRRNNRTQVPMEIGNDLRTLFNEKPVLSLIHPDKLDNPLPVEEDSAICKERSNRINFPFSTDNFVTEQPKKTPDARPVLSLIHPDKLKRMTPPFQIQITTPN